MVDRWACVNVPALPLQLLLVQHPEWTAHPVAVISRDAPQGMVVRINDRAAKAGIRPGMRYASALGIEPSLRADVVPPENISRCVARLADRLQKFSPEIEPSEATSDVFWLNATGMVGVYRTYSAWAQDVRVWLRDIGFRSTVVVGFTRFGTYAVSKVRKGITEFRDVDTERTTADRVDLVALDLLPRDLQTLDLLGVSTVGELLALPQTGLRSRFGDELYEFHRWASGDLWAPLQAHHDTPPLSARAEWELAEGNAGRLLATMENLLEPLLNKLSARGEAVQGVQWDFSLANAQKLSQDVRPAVPTLDLRLLLDLIRLRFESEKLPADVEEILIVVRGTRATADQIELLASVSRRDLAAADRALARIRAQFGDSATVRARLENGHLPEACYRWEVLTKIQLPKPPAEEARPENRPLVRRIYTRPHVFTERHTLVRSAGPYIVSGGWWNTAPGSPTIHREYHFAETRDHRMLWIYYDRKRCRWMLQGCIE